MAGLLEKLRGAQNDEEFPDEIPEELLSEFTADPAPGKRRAAPRKAAPAVTRPAAKNSTLKRRISAELEAYAKMAALGLSMRDEHCGGVLNAQAKAIADSLADILSRNPQLAERFLQAGVIGDWAKLLAAIAPVASAFYAHHVAKTVEQDTDDESVAYPPYRPGA